MQETRRQILEILYRRDEATVDNIVTDLEAIRGSITAVTVRHHLGKLQSEGLVSVCETRQRSTPGRPQHIYALTSHGSSYFPNNYQKLSTELLQQMKQHLPDSQVNVIIEGVADAMVAAANIPQGSLKDRLDAVVIYLNEHGYDADWDTTDGGFVLSTHNCPYHHIEDEHLCQMDMRLVSGMLGIVPRLTERALDGQHVCSYFIPNRSNIDA